MRAARTLLGALCAAALSVTTAHAQPATKSAKPKTVEAKPAMPARAAFSAAVKRGSAKAGAGDKKQAIAAPEKSSPATEATEQKAALPSKPRGYAVINELGRAPHPDIPGPVRIPDSQIEPLGWNALDGWNEEKHAEVFEIFRNSCKPVIGVARANNDQRPVLHALASVCRRAIALNQPTNERAKEFFEENFVPTRINKLGDTAGFLTGYYEPVVDGSRFPTHVYKVPVYRRPPDLVPPAGTPKGVGFPNTGQSMRRTSDGSLVPYHARGDIENGALDGQHLEICWIKDPIDLLFIQIQGSARIKLEDGTWVRVNYDAHNGYPYTAIGRILIERKEVPREEMSMDRIRQWMVQQADGGKELRSHNRGFVFFRVVGLSDDGETSGAQGIPLTARRSIAVDKALHVYGTPFFIEAELTGAPSREEVKFRRTMIAQDTGSAIVGAARADIYFGVGDSAGKIAGRIRNPGKFAMLMPRELDPAVAGAAMPLPSARPNVEEIIARIARNGFAGDKAPRENTADKTEKAPEKPAPEKALPRSPPEQKSRVSPSRTEQSLETRAPPPLPKSKSRNKDRA